MNAPKPMLLGAAAIQAGTTMQALFAPAICRAIALAHVATWVDAQDESIAAYRVMTTAQQAIRAINAHPWG